MYMLTDRGADSMAPDATAAEAIVSDDVVTATPTVPVVGFPIVNPLIVTVKDVRPMDAPDIVITTVVVVVALHVTVSPATLLPPAPTVGVTDGAKKPEG